MTAIAAAIACSTPSFAQSADPPAAETPAPVVAAPVVAEPIVPDAPVAVDTLAPAEAVAKPAVRKATTAKAAPATKAGTARARPAPTRTASSAPAVAAAPPPAAADVAPVAETPALEPLPVEPEVAPLAAPAATEDASSMDGMMLPIAAGGLAILALAGAALLMRRRKRRAAQTEELALREEELVAIDEAEPAMMVEPEPEPVRAPAGQFGKSAFVAAAAPGVIAPQPSPQIDRPVTASEPSPEIDGPATDVPDDVAPGSRVEAAYAGPTADNPSLSIKKRLKRAAFFDQREMLVEAGEATPVAEDAGLPDALDPAPDTRDSVDKTD